MAKHRRRSVPPLPSGEGGYEFEVIEPGPPTYFTPPPPIAARGGLIPMGDGEGFTPRPAPPSVHRPAKKSKGMKLRTFTARFRNATADGITQVTVQGHELWYTPNPRTEAGESSSVVEVLLHLPVGTISVAMFRLGDLLGLFEGRIVHPSTTDT